MSENQHPDHGGQEGRNNPYAQHAQAAAVRAKAAAQDALGAARRLITNPAGTIGDAHASLGGERLLGVAIVFAVVAALCIALASTRTMGMLMYAMGMGGTGVGAFFKAMLNALIGIVAVGGGVLIMAPLLGGRANPASALFIAATAVLPMAIASVLAWLVGMLLQNQLGGILAMLLMLYGFSYLIMVLNAGLRQVCGVNESRAALGTPTVLAIAMLVMWLWGQLMR
ncbi:YIP1 family protein [Pseudofulvimonas gallinarii]|jgi:hypothetical protein|uniref:Yip1 domain-containing protein n=1 Tax=Pseudofulvimonas gallinarii TaxID=634155 RepID=A0A4V2UWH8_9GAMM|nr:YIP1 family protein [Pseudofulvimonas gallinarii]TCS99707.1 hypothetical protein EDC25_105142 [Pseudofulvimonas gallinarii]THD15256.1 hypothetical protein B1808_00140 [Pseudofulvimonas gallinarii]